MFGSGFIAIITYAAAKSASNPVITPHFLLTENDEDMFTESDEPIDTES